MTYQYSNEQITCKYIKESQSYTTNETHTYTLSNGLIVKDIEVQNNMETTTIYSYNGNGYLTSLSQWGDVIASSTKDFVWTNGNLTSMDGREFKYSNTPWNKGMFFNFKGSNMDGYLWSGGYWGNTPKYMPSQDVYKNWTYNYETSNGLVTRITMTVNKTGEKVISSIVWE